MSRTISTWPGTIFPALGIWANHLGEVSDMVFNIKRQGAEGGHMALDRTCLASHLIARLQSLVAEHGDLPVYARDADTGWRLPIGLMFRAEQIYDERPDRIEVTTDYNDRPSHDFEPEDSQ